MLRRHRGYSRPNNSTALRRVKRATSANSWRGNSTVGFFHKQCVQPSHRFTHHTNAVREATCKYRKFRGLLMVIKKKKRKTPVITQQTLSLDISTMLRQACRQSRPVCLLALPRGSPRQPFPTTNRLWEFGNTADSLRQKGPSHGGGRKGQFYYIGTREQEGPKR